ncbi:hypothetical protein [Maritalea sp.]|uniref:hypothetical protein n=1 Tax=Maritalea sp. TaxID=2003361 RepID=UPI003EFA0B6E
MTKHDTHTEEKTVVEPTEARQGRPTFALRILVISTAVLVLAFLVVSFFTQTSAG